MSSRPPVLRLVSSLQNRTTTLGEHGNDPSQRAEAMYQSREAGYLGSTARYPGHHPNFRLTDQMSTGY